MPHPTIKIELLNHRDAAVAGQLFAIFQQAYRHEARLIGVEDFPPLRRSIRDIQLADTSFRGCSIAGGMVGAIEVNSKSPELHIDSLAVLPELFGKGIGSRLVTHALHQASWKTATVQTAAVNVAALALYRKMGFTQQQAWTSKEGIALVSLHLTTASTAPPPVSTS